MGRRAAGATVAGGTRGRARGGRVARRRRVWRGSAGRAWAVLPVALALVAAAGHGVGAARQEAPRPAAAVRVAPGDTLWGLAARHAPPGTDPRVWIFRTERLNGLAGAELRPGEVLRLPAGSR
jgi:Tfp pilus assembly protein FimV